MGSRTSLVVDEEHGSPYTRRMSFLDFVTCAVAYLIANIVYEAVKHFTTKKKREKEFAEKVQNVFNLGVTFGRSLERKEGQSGTLEIYGVTINITPWLVPAETLTLSDEIERVKSAKVSITLQE